MNKTKIPFIAILLMGCIITSMSAAYVAFLLYSYNTFMSAIYGILNIPHGTLIDALPVSQKQVVLLYFGCIQLFFFMLYIFLEMRLMRIPLKYAMNRHASRVLTAHVQMSVPTDTNRDFDSEKLVRREAQKGPQHGPALQPAIYV
jgi:hypothetical protein